MEVKLYVNGQPASRTVEGTFVPDSRFPMIGQNLEWPDRQLKGMVAFASGDTQFPVEHAEADVYVQSLYHVRLRKLQECSEAVVELDLTAGSGNDYYIIMTAMAITDFSLRRMGARGQCSSGLKNLN